MLWYLWCKKHGRLLLGQAFCDGLEDKGCGGDLTRPRCRYTLTLTGVSNASVSRAAARQPKGRPRACGGRRHEYEKREASFKTSVRVTSHMIASEAVEVLMAKIVGSRGFLVSGGVHRLGLRPFIYC